MAQLRQEFAESVADPVILWLLIVRFELAMPVRRVKMIAVFEPRSGNRLVIFYVEVLHLDCPGCNLEFSYSK